MKPTETKNSRGIVYTHPAQGTISITRRQCGGGGIALFGSALRHHALVTITLQTAELHRDLHRNWTFPRQTIAEFHMSEGQWAQFVSSIGQGGGTPVTLVRYQEAEKLSLMPEIEVEPVKKTFDAEMKKKAQETVATAVAAIKELQALADSPGSVSKKDLKKITHDFKCFIDNLPPNMAFIQTQFAEAMEQTVQQGKSEIEGFVRNTLINAGMAHLADEAAARMLTSTSMDSIQLEHKA